MPFGADSCGSDVAQFFLTKLYVLQLLDFRWAPLGDFRTPDPYTGPPQLAKPAYASARSLVLDVGPTPVSMSRQCELDVWLLYVKTM